MTYKEKLNETMSVQELIDVLMTIEDKSQKVLVCAYPEWDNCTTEIPITKDNICPNNVSFSTEDDSKMIAVTKIDADWLGDYDNDDDEEESEEDEEESGDEEDNVIIKKVFDGNNGKRLS